MVGILTRPPHLCGNGDSPAHPWGSWVPALSSASGRFGKHGRVLVEAVDGEDLAVVDGDVLGEEPGAVAAQALGVDTENEPTGQAVVASPAIDVRS